MIKEDEEEEKKEISWTSGELGEYQNLYSEKLMDRDTLFVSSTDGGICYIKHKIKLWNCAIDSK